MWHSALVLDGCACMWHSALVLDGGAMYHFVHLHAFYSAVGWSRESYTPAMAMLAPALPMAVAASFAFSVHSTSIARA